MNKRNIFLVIVAGIALTVLAVEFKDFPVGTPSTSSKLSGTTGASSGQLYNLTDIFALIDTNVFVAKVNITNQVNQISSTVSAGPNIVASITANATGSSNYMVQVRSPAYITNSFFYETNYPGYVVIGNGDTSYFQPQNSMGIAFSPTTSDLRYLYWPQDALGVDHADIYFWPNHINGHPELIFDSSGTMAFTASAIQWSIAGNWLDHIFQYSQYTFNTYGNNTNFYDCAVIQTYGAMVGTNTVNLVWAGSKAPAGTFAAPASIDRNYSPGWLFRGAIDRSGDSELMFFSRIFTGNSPWTDAKQPSISVRAGDEPLLTAYNGLRIAQVTNVPPSLRLIGTNSGMLWSSNTYLYWCYSADGTTSNSPVKIAP